MKDVEVGEIKMSDVFVLPISSNKGDLFNSKNPISDTRVCQFYNMNQFQASKAAELAINSHDKLTEQNNMLREVLDKVVAADDSHYQDEQEYAEAINHANDILEKTKC